MKKLIFLSVFVLMVAGCAAKAVPAPAPVSGLSSLEKAAATGEGAARAAWEVEWEKVVADAKREGTVVVYSSAGPEARTGLAPALKQKYGIQMEYTTGRGIDVAGKFIAERKAGIYTGDVYFGGSTTMVIDFKQAGVLDPIEPALILPEVKDPKAWLGEELYFVDKAHTTLQFVAQPMQIVGINTQLVKPGEISRLRDLLNPKWKGKLVMNDPTKPGIGGKWFSAEAQRIGLDFFRELAKQEPLIIADQRLQVEWVAQGKYPVVITPMADPVAAFLRAGAPIKVIDIEDSRLLTSASGNIGLMNRAPHPNAARVFINWLLTREGQITFSQATLTQSSRLDVPYDFLPEGRPRNPQVKYYNVEKEEIVQKADEDYKRARDIFGHLLR